MSLYSLKVQTLVARWKHFRSSSSAIFVDDTVPQWVLYCVCWYKKSCDQLFGAGKYLSTCSSARIWHLRTFISSPNCYKTHMEVWHRTMGVAPTTPVLPSNKDANPRYSDQWRTHHVTCQIPRFTAISASHSSKIFYKKEAPNITTA